MISVMIFLLIFFAFKSMPLCYDFPSMADRMLPFRLTSILSQRPQMGLRVHVYIASFALMSA
jgi:hypothetical protein